MKFLFCPLATHGFVYPAIAVALALKGQGHEVAFATDASFEEVLRGVDIERIPRGEKDGTSFQISRWADPLVIAMEVKHIEFALQRFAADALVAHPLSLGPLIVRERLALPVAVLGMAAHLWPCSSRAVTPDAPEAEKRKAWRHDDMMGYLNGGRKLFKLPPIDAGPADSPMLGDLFLLQSVPEIAGDEDTYSERVHQIGACLWEPVGLDPELAHFLDEASAARAPLLYVHHGRVFDRPSFWPPLAEALGSRPFRVAASVGRMDKPTGDIPAHFLVRPHVPQGAIMSRASMVVAGANTTVILGALAHGLPSLLIPGGGEQPDLAEQVARAGAARCLPFEELSPARLVEVIAEVLESEALKRGAHALGDAFAKKDGPALAAARIERLAATRRPVLREHMEASEPVASP